MKPVRRPSSHAHGMCSVLAVIDTYILKGATRNQNHVHGNLLPPSHQAGWFLFQDLGNSPSFKHTVKDDQQCQLISILGTF